MSSEIVTGNQTPTKPVPWRMVSAVSLSASSRRSDAEQHSASMLDQARREAFAEGLAAGRQQAEEQIRPAMEGLAQVLAELARLRSAIREQETEALVRLAVSVAARVIHRELVIDPDALAGLVKASFTKAQSREINRVRMHPALETLVRRSLEQCGAPKNLVLTADPGLKTGEVFFETAQGILDGSVETQLSEIERGLIDQLER
jgi:flagellar assembly protein FliH